MAEFVQIKGLSELHKALQQLPAKIEGNIMRGALRAGAAVFKAEALRLVPQDTGRLKDSIRTSVRLRNGRVEGTVKAGGRTSKKVVRQMGNGRFRIVYENPWYAHLVEFGTAAHVIKPRRAKSLWSGQGWAKQVEHPGARPKPFLRPTFDGQHGAATDAVADYIRKRLPREMQKVR